MILSTLSIPEIMNILAETLATAQINAPLESIDLTRWLFTLTDEEYQNCSKDHIAGGASLTGDGDLVSINVEIIADNLLVQHYIAEISEPGRCRVHSKSDSFSAFGKTKLGITWEVSVKRISGTRSEFSNRVIVSMTEEFSALLEKAGIADINVVKQSMLMNASAHNQEETPLFAKDIERKALAGIWSGTL
jgi:hypothetical protein